MVEILARNLENEPSLHRRVDLFFLVDSITQCSRSQKGIEMSLLNSCGIDIYCWLAFYSYWVPFATQIYLLYWCKHSYERACVCSSIFLTTMSSSDYSKNCRGYWRNILFSCPNSASSSVICCCSFWKWCTWKSSAMSQGKEHKNYVLFLFSL